MARTRATDSASLLKAAATVFESKGYRNSTIDDIADAAGVSRPTVYKYTSSKRALLDGIVDAVCDAQRGQLREVLDGSEAPVAKLRRIIAMHVENATHMRSLYTIVFAEQAELSDDAVARFQDHAHILAVDLEHLLDECVEQRADVERSENRAEPVDTWIAANLVLTMLTALYRWYDPHGATGPEALCEQILTLLSGILPSGTTAASQRVGQAAISG